MPRRETWKKMTFSCDDPAVGCGEELLLRALLLLPNFSVHDFTQHLLYHQCFLLYCRVLELYIIYIHFT